MQKNKKKNILTFCFYCPNIGTDQDKSERYQVHFLREIEKTFLSYLQRGHLKTLKLIYSSSLLSLANSIITEGH